MENRAGIRISTRSFAQAALILFALMIGAGILTRVMPAGSYARAESEGRQVIIPGSYRTLPQPDYPAWRWLTAPLEVLGSPDGLTILTIIVFLLFVGASFAVLDGCGLLRLVLQHVVARFGGRKYALLLAISFLFMSLGAFFGIFEEVVPLVPLVIALSYSLGWDALLGLGMSILATNMGFTAAITNPFTIGIAQRLAQLPLFSGAWLRVPIFMVMYALLALFLVRYARRLDKEAASGAASHQGEAHRFPVPLPKASTQLTMRQAAAWFGVCLALILLVLIAGPFVPGLSDYSLPLVGLLFLAAGVGAGWLSGAGRRTVLRSVGQGLAGIAPAIPLILMAASVKHIVSQGQVMDTVLHHASLAFEASNPVVAAAAVYLVTLLIEFFVASASAKAFLLMPILIPLAGLIGLTRQTAVLAYCFGDGFSNLAYPTNPVLLISLGLAAVPYAKWIRWTAGLWALIAALSLAFLALAAVIGYGPF